MTQPFIYGVHAEFRDKSGNFPEFPGGVHMAYKSKSSARKRFDRLIKSGVYDRVTITLQNAVYLPDDNINIATWEK